MTTTPIDMDGCREVLAEAEELAEGVSSQSDRCPILLNIADLWGQIGGTAKQIDMIDRATRFASDISLSVHQGYIHLLLVEALTRSGNLEKAVQIVRLMMGHHSDALHHLVKLQAENGHIPDALRTAEDESQTHLRANLLETIGMTQAKAGDCIGGLQTLEQALLLLTDRPYEGSKSYLLMHMVEIQIEIGELTEAVQTAVTIPMHVHRDGALGKIADAHLQRRDFDQAEQTMNHMQESLAIARTLCNVALAQSERGLECRQTLERARLAVDRAEETDDESIAQKAHAMKRVAQTQAQTGDRKASRATLIQAREIASRIPDDEMKEFALTLIAQAFAEIGQEAAYQNTLALAYRAINAITDELHKEVYHRGIAVAQARAGRIKDSQDTLALLRKADGSPDWDSIAFAQEQIGNTTAMVHAAQQIVQPNRRNRYLLKAAEVRAKAGNIDGCRETLALVRDTIQHLTDPADKLQTLLQIAKIQAGLP